MIYDLARVNDASHINGVVNNIRSCILCGSPTYRVAANLKCLVPFLRFEVCERFLNYSFSLPYVPWRDFKGLTVKQMSSLIAARDAHIRTTLSAYAPERVRVSHSDLVPYAKTSIKRPGVGMASTFASRNILVFENGAKLDETAPSFFLYNPRGILLVVLTMAKYNERCNEVLKLMLDSVCKDDSWLIPDIPPSIPLIRLEETSEASEEPKKRNSTPVLIAAPMAHQEAQEGFIDRPLTWGANGSATTSGASSEFDSETVLRASQTPQEQRNTPETATPIPEEEAAPTPLQEPQEVSLDHAQMTPESALAVLLSALKPGTEIRIVVPA